MVPDRVKAILDTHAATTRILLGVVAAFLFLTPAYGDTDAPLSADAPVQAAAPIPRRAEFFNFTANFLGSTASLPTQPNVRKASTISLSTSNSSPGYGQAITFTAHVAGMAGPPTGTVNFYDGNAFLGTGTLSGGQATFTTSTLSVGTHKITATYSGDANFNPATTPNPLTQTVTTKVTGRLVG